MFAYALANVADKLELDRTITFTVVGTIVAQNDVEAQGIGMAECRRWFPIEGGYTNHRITLSAAIHPNAFMTHFDTNERYHLVLTKKGDSTNDNQ